MKSGMVVRVTAAVGAAALAGLSYTLPLWSLTMQAPQYPKGLRLQAYGHAIRGDLRELNILNHYIGMPPIEMPQLEAALFPYGIGALVLACLLSPLHRYLRRLAVFALTATPVVILADLQWWLYRFGHSLDPHAPIRLKPFTPLVLGTSTMGNFVSSGMISTGIVMLLAAAAVLLAGEWIGRRMERRATPLPVSERRTAAAAACVLAAAGLPAVSTAQPLQQRLDDAARGSTVVVDGGVYHGPIVIRGPLAVVGRNAPVLDGGGVGSVVTIEGHGVVFRGFVVQNSGRQVTEEAAGIKVTGDGHVIEDNTVRDVYFGIHVAGGGQQVVRRNTIVPGERHGARPGHGISLWHTRDTQVVENHISRARDGIYLSFTRHAFVSANEVRSCRYGVHSMYSRDASIVGNVIAGNLLGAALMMSDRLSLRGNRIQDHREGAAAYGVLLKDIGDLTAEENTIAANRVGVYAESVPTDRTHEALVTRNLIVGNEVGLALQSNAALTVVGNRIAENLTDVRPLGRELSPDVRWSRDGRGNSWGQYRGYDANHDGVGDLPHEAVDAMESLLRKSPLAQAFLYTPAHRALEAAARMFPSFRTRPVLVDAHPLMAWTTPGGQAGGGSR